VVSRIPFPQEIRVDGKRVSVPPYELVTLTGNKLTAPKITAGKTDAGYRKWLAERLESYGKLYKSVRALDPEAAPEAYRRVAVAARRHLTRGELYTADRVLAPGLASELRLRQEILRPPVVRAPRLRRPPSLEGNLNRWPSKASDLRAETGEFLAGHTFFPNSWTGPEDLSARLRLGHDGTNLYVGLEIRDSVLSGKDSCMIRMSYANYRKWRGDSHRYEITMRFALPLARKKVTGSIGTVLYTSTQTERGYAVEAIVPLKDLKVKPGGACGFLVVASDTDRGKNLCPESWAQKQTLLLPHQPNFTFWSDARTTGEVVFER
jgi:hypothetical protein